MKLEERDRRLLALLGTRVRAAGDLADDLGVPAEALEGRLAELADDGLVYDRGDGRFERTESGRRVLVASATGADDERIDTTPAVEAALESLALRPDEADALRHAFALLRYWGRATEAEIADAIYSEAPAGRGSPAEWWEEVVREPLAALPGVDPPGSDGEPWRHAGPPEADQPGTHGRRVLSRHHPVYGDVKHALESLDLSEPEREAARAAFGYLYRRGEATERELGEAVYPDHPAGYDSSAEWWGGFVRDAFDALPGVERADAGGERPDVGGEQSDEVAWRYRRP